MGPTGILSAPGSVEALDECRGDLIAGGSFSRAGDVDAAHIARWDGSAWHSLGLEGCSGISALAVLESTLVAAGRFERSGGGFRWLAARFDGTTWSRVGGTFESEIVSLAIYRHELYAGSELRYSSGDTLRTTFVWRWDGTNDQGRDVASGVSWARLDAEGTIRQARLVVTR